MTDLARTLLLLGCVACAGTPSGQPTDVPSNTDVTDPTDDGVDASLGAISGDCGRLSDALASEAPALLRTRIDLAVTSFEGDDVPLSDGGQRLRDTPNLGGSSSRSELLAFELLHRCEDAALVATEAEVVYEDDGGKKTDLVVTVGAERLGDSVVRAYGYPPEDPWTEEEALPLVERKLNDILLSTENVVDEDAWERQILSVIAYSDAHADTFADVWAGLDDATRADTILYVTVTDGDDTFIYQE